MREGLRQPAVPCTLCGGEATQAVCRSSVHPALLVLLCRGCGVYFTTGSRDQAAALYSAYWSGAAIGLDEANFDVPDRATRAAVSGLAAVHRPRSQTVPVDSFQANPWGLFGVHGNVWEWTSDCWSEQQHMVTRRTSYRMPPLPPCGRRAARGGSWNDLASETRSAARIGFAADSRNAQQGFRVVRSLR